MKKEKDNQNLHIPFASRQDMILYVALGVLNIALVAVLCEFLTFIPPVLVALVIGALYLIEIALIGLRRIAKSRMYPARNIHSLLGEEGSVVFKNSRAPIIIFDLHGTILWYNDSMRVALDSYNNYIGEKISEVLNIELPVDEETGISRTTVAGKEYGVEGFVISKKNNGLYIAMLSDVTELSALEKKYNDERVAVAYIAIDNVEDVLQYVHEKLSDAVVSIEDKLKAWAASMNGVIKSYDNDKYIMFFDSMYLDECIANRFEILDQIRDARVGDGVSITVSIGVSRRKGTLLDRELDARDAIDLALQRGGDQVVYKSEDETIYFGGRTKTVYKRSNVRSRAFANQLTALMSRADNVIIMGHKYGDFDSFGASIGVARLAMLCGIKVNIAVDLFDKNLRPCIEMMQKTEAYSQVFVDNAGGLDLIGPDTLVVLVDHNSIPRSQFSDIASKTASIAVIDHHRKNDQPTSAVKISYIEPSASSTCELVSEMLESVVSSQNLLKQEADILLSGILLDTKQFTRNTGTRTFGAAQYLRGAGANPTDVYNLFKAAPEDLSKEARFHTSIIMYKTHIALACCEGDTDESYRVIASKAADKMLTLRGVAAAFTLVKIGEQIHISGRSSGKVNVQLILEKLRGGGHFDVAGAQVVSDSIDEVLETLKKSIDDYLEHNPI
ncbi:MAG: DHH family phosphoesterase [Clostridia bacterium]|nr:DHH family phosphoesterase [Clostridia bacterium]